MPRRARLRHGGQDATGSRARATSRRTRPVPRAGARRLRLARDDAGRVRALEDTLDRGVRRSPSVRGAKSGRELAGRVVTKVQPGRAIVSGDGQPPRLRRRPALLLRCDGAIHGPDGVRLPPEMEADNPKARERARSQELQRDGSWVHLWRVAGRQRERLRRGVARRAARTAEQPPAVPAYRRARDSASASPVQARFNRLRRRGD